MDRFNTSAGAAAVPATPAAPVNKYFTSGNPSLAIPATVPGPWWFHMISEELRNVIVAAGLTPDHANTNQLSQAIAALVTLSNRAVILEAAVFEASVVNGEAVYWDAGNNRFDEAIADGTAKQNCVGFADVTNSKVYAFGVTALFIGLTPGAKYYLSTTVAGGITTVLPSANVVQVGIAKSATDLLTDIDPTGNVGLATETVAGISEEATQTEVNNGTAGTFFVTPSKNRFGFAISLGSNGYVKLPNWLGGVIFQWGAIATAGTVTFPIAFPNNVYVVLATINSDVGTAGNETVSTFTKTLTNFQLAVLNSGFTAQASWFAVGN